MFLNVFIFTLPIRIVGKLKGMLFKTEIAKTAISKASFVYK